MARVRLYLDEDVWEGLAEALRRAGYDVVSAGEAGRKGFGDESQLTYAATQDRAILTHNIRDFVILAKLCAVQGINHAGIIVASQSGKRERMRRTTTLLESLSAEDIANTLQFL